MITTQTQKLIEKHLGGSLTDGEWSLLVRKRLTDKIERQEVTAAQVAHVVLEWRDAVLGDPTEEQREVVRTLEPPGERGKGKKRERHSRHLTDRREAVASLLAKEAAKEELVIDFRRRVLRGQLIKFENLGGWIKRKAKKDGPSTRWIEVPIPAKSEFKLTGIKMHVSPEIRIGKNHPFDRTMFRPLRYAKHNSNLVEGKLVANGGVLDKLRRVSEYLATRYGWHEATATIFVLTGRIPVPDPLRVVSHPKMPISVASRIELSVDPTCSPAQVRDAYQRARKRLVGEKHREPIEKTIVLAQWAVEREERGETLAQSLKRWNKLYPDWRQKEETNFGRDLTRAWRQLVQPRPGA